MYLFSFATADKRFETLNDLVEDGLIAMYIESNAKDYIDTMMLDAALNVSAPLERASGGSPRRVSVQDEHGRKEAVKKLFNCCNYATNQPSETWIKSLSPNGIGKSGKGGKVRQTCLTCSAPKFADLFLVRWRVLSRHNN